LHAVARGRAFVDAIADGEVALGQAEGEGRAVDEGLVGDGDGSAAGGGCRGEHGDAECVFHDGLLVQRRRATHRLSRELVPATSLRTQAATPWPLRLKDPKAVAPRPSTGSIAAASLQVPPQVS